MDVMKDFGKYSTTMREGVSKVNPLETCHPPQPPFYLLMKCARKSYYVEKPPNYA